LGPDQEWCLNCGAAAGTEVVEPRGWRVPLYLGGGLTALAVIGVILAIVALASRNDVVAENPTPTPSAAAPPGATPTPSPLATTTPVPSVTASPTASPDDPNASPTAEPSPTESATPMPSPTEAPGNQDGGSGSTFPGWTGADGDYTIIIESAETQSGAEKVAQEAQSNGETVGILKSDDYSSLNAGYWVVFTGTYSSKSAAQDALEGVKAQHSDAYVRQIKS
jgi:septal ring-binding cell division protein DamX